MDILKELERFGCEQLVICRDPASGLSAVIAIHNTKLGPALGGCRMWPYASAELAVTDALRLAKGMTYKAAVSGLRYGGGKAVIIGDPATDSKEALFRAFGRYVQHLQGRYITGIDLGTTVQDMDWIQIETEYVTDVTGSLGSFGEYTAEMTAYGVFLGIKASVGNVFGSEILKDMTAAVQGLGKVGFFLCRYLHEAGAQLIVTDIHEGRLNRVVSAFGARAVAPAKIYGQVCDVFAPCALGGVINDQTLALLKCKIVAGAANNQLAEERHGDALHSLGILYAPDYVINAGGIITTAADLEGYDAAYAKQRVAHISRTIARVFHTAEAQGIAPSASADRMAEELLGKA
ncbi:Glu/Leu/Phe/Val dehydrogenase dimerization domain-containing protein [Paenibacillus piri]|uniref:Glu/Leu/Phe/Val dehydrogenase n=1 Tax=Paenibacillus piri TaxID=2547395 RepID=A0A4R5KYD6_9BACL|nr:Glu/Leu/Phe/Val dehydrogenase dimerization domain-containing protein [Paenibacillus piri]TDG00249.1 Glu/Leu/Phe/Val dehydrogenase [Paenibacillus piri]